MIDERETKMTIKIRKWDAGKTDVIVTNRYGDVRTHNDVTVASESRVEKMVSGKRREFTRKYDYTMTVIKM